MSSRIDAGARAAKSGVRSLREFLSHALHQGQALAKDAVDASGRRADVSLDAVEKAVVGLLGAISRQGQSYADEGKNRVYAAESRLFPRRRTRPIGTTLLAVGAGIALSLLLSPTNRKVGQAPKAKTAPPVE
jgi:hypothetical protein